MSTRSERMNDKAMNERHAKILKALMQLPENKSCAECKRKDPRWASHSLGVFVCLRCSGVHRSMGTHISKMKSVDLDSWTPEQVQNMIDWGNARANWYWEAKASFEPNDSNIDMYIRCKYDRRQFVRQSAVPNPKTIPVGSPFNTTVAPSQYADAPAAVTGSPSPTPLQQQHQQQQHQQQQQPRGANAFGNGGNNLLNFEQSPPKMPPRPSSGAGASVPAAAAAAPAPAAPSNPFGDILSLYNTAPQKPAAQPAAVSAQPQGFAAFGAFAAAPTQPPNATTPSGGGGGSDAFADFGGFSSAPAAAAAAPKPSGSPGFGDFGAFSSAPSAASTSSGFVQGFGGGFNQGFGGAKASSPSPPPQQPQQPAATSPGFGGFGASAASSSSAPVPAPAAAPAPAPVPSSSFATSMQSFSSSPPFGGTQNFVAAPASASPGVGGALSTSPGFGGFGSAASAAPSSNSPPLGAAPFTTTAASSAFASLPPMTSGFGQTPSTTTQGQMNAGGDAFSSLNWGSFK